MIDAATFTEKGKIESDLCRRAVRPAPAGSTRRPSTSASPQAVAVTENGERLYIGVENADVPGVVVYDLRAGRALKKLDLLLTGGHYFAIQPKTGKIYYPHKEDNRIVVIDTYSDKVVKIIPVPGGPRGVDFAPNGEVWLHQDTDGSVAVVDSNTDEDIRPSRPVEKESGVLPCLLKATTPFPPARKRATSRSSTRTRKRLSPICGLARGRVYLPRLSVSCSRCLAR